jgi:hypothetical protein
MYFSLIKHLGPGWLAQRLWFKFENKLGLLEKRMPKQSWANLQPISISGSAALWRKKTPYLPIGLTAREELAPWCENYAIESGHSPVAEARGLAQGKLRIFHSRFFDLGFPFNWNRNVLSGSLLENKNHWSKITDAGNDDIKGVWEASRFSWVFSLVRGWIIEGADFYPETFWRLFEDWMEKNPPNQGPQWMCGQEAAMRLIAVAYALQAFRNHSASTDKRIALTTQLAEATAQRISGHINYAISQANNHGISEAVGLFTAGVLWPNCAHSSEWRAKGIETLLPQIQKLVNPDGGFSQHSTNYHRLFLHLMIWSEIVLRAEKQTFPEITLKKIKAATRFLSDLMDSDGQVPRYGADDGAYLFPLSGSAHDDFRPVVNAAQILFLGSRLPEGPWDEEALLLCGPISSTAPEYIPKDFIDKPYSGVSILRNPMGTLFFRAPQLFRHRPSHADQLHVSIKWGNEWITEDVGTFSYNSRQVGADGANANQHNVVTVNNGNPMRRFSRFLWLPWTRCKRLIKPDWIRASHSGYANHTCERTIQKLPQGFIIIDKIKGKAKAEISLRWQGRSRAALEQLAITCSAESREDWQTANEKTGEGWYSSSYGVREASWVRTISTRASTVVFVTAIGCLVKLEKNELWVDNQKYIIL